MWWESLEIEEKLLLKENGAESMITDFFCSRIALLRNVCAYININVLFSNFNLHGSIFVFGDSTIEPWKDSNHKILIEKTMKYGLDE